MKYKASSFNYSTYCDMEKLYATAIVSFTSDIEVKQ